MILDRPNIIWVKAGRLSRSRYRGRASRPAQARAKPFIPNRTTSWYSVTSLHQTKRLRELKVDRGHCRGLKCHLHLITMLMLDFTTRISWEMISSTCKRLVPLSMMKEREMIDFQCKVQTFMAGHFLIKWTLKTARSGIRIWTTPTHSKIVT